MILEAFSSWPISRRTPAAVLVGAAAIGSLAGGLLGGVSRIAVDDRQSPGGRAGAASAGDLLLAVPGSWSRAAGGSRIASLDSSHGVSLDTPTSRVSIVAHVRPGGPSLLPLRLTRAVAQPLPTPLTVRAGRVAAYAYLGLLQRRPRIWFDVYAVPTTRGTAAIACSVGSDHVLLDLARYDCEEALRRLRLIRGRAVSPDPETAFALALPLVIDRLAAARRAGRRALAAATTPGARSLAAAQTSAAYGVAGRSLARLASATPAERATLDGLGRLATAYGALALSAGRDDAFGYAAAASAIQAGETMLQRRLSIWQREMAAR